MSLKSDSNIKVDSLILYKGNPAVVLKIDVRLKIKIENGKTMQVRINDVTFLHSGPFEFHELKPMTGDIEAAWDLVAGEVITLPEMSDLIFGCYNPRSSYSCWKIIEEGLFFHGNPDSIQARTKDDLKCEKEKREAKIEEDRNWNEFIGRLKTKNILPEDRKGFTEIEDVAYGRLTKSKILKELNKQISCESAHRMLLDFKIWDESFNPHPERCGISLSSKILEPGSLPDEKRVDLSELESFAIDDEWTADPDDAISIDGERLWVHIADVASIVKPGTEIDNQAGDRGASLYLPDKTIPMIPPDVADFFGLGLHDLSPALSFGISLNEDSEVTDVIIQPSMIRAKRVTYLQAEELLDRSPLNQIYQITQKFREMRKKNGAADINLPEAKIKVKDNEISITPLPSLRSRGMVTDAMLMAGRAVAEFAVKNEIPIPFATQSPPEMEERPSDLAGMYALRKEMKPGQTKCIPDSHAGLGLNIYTRVTSPIRRYSDLVAHQQLRAFLKGEKLLDEQAILERNGLYESAIENIRKAEKLSNIHWIILFLMRNKNWEGRATVLEKNERRAVVTIPSLGIESRINLKKDAALNDEVLIGVARLDLVDLALNFYHIL